MCRLTLNNEISACGAIDNCIELGTSVASTLMPFIATVSFILNNLCKRKSFSALLHWEVLDIFVVINTGYGNIIVIENEIY